LKLLNVVVGSGNRNIVNEAFRLLRTNLEFITPENGEANVIALTSFNPGSGKSFISINLAITLAIKNHKVLVIDGDMRHGSSSAYVNSPDKGLSNYLTHKIDNISEVIVKDKSLSNLDVLPIGKFPPNPAELIGDYRFTSLITELKKQYDYILIDCPPIDIVSDALIIEKVVDRTLFVIRVGLLERVLLNKLEQFYVSKRFKNLSVIINGANDVKGSYGYGYGYGYEYGNDGDNKIDWVQ
jgi:capsular exopolysaccharide family